MSLKPAPSAWTGPRCSRVKALRWHLLPLTLLLWNPLALVSFSPAPMPGSLCLQTSPPGIGPQFAHRASLLFHVRNIPSPATLLKGKILWVPYLPDSFPFPCSTSCRRRHTLVFSPSFIFPQGLSPCPACHWYSAHMCQMNESVLTQEDHKCSFQPKWDTKIHHDL